MIFIISSNIFASILNLYVWGVTGNGINLYFSGVSLGVSIMLILEFYTGGLL